MLSAYVLVEKVELQVTKWSHLVMGKTEIHSFWNKINVIDETGKGMSA